MIYMIWVFVLLGIIINIYLIVRGYNNALVTQRMIYYPNAKNRHDMFVLSYQTKREKQKEFLKDLAWIVFLLILGSLFGMCICYLMCKYVDVDINLWNVFLFSMLYLPPFFSLLQNYVFID